MKIAQEDVSVDGRSVRASIDVAEVRDTWDRD